MPLINLPQNNEENNSNTKDLNQQPEVKVVETQGPSIDQNPVAPVQTQTNVTEPTVETIQPQPQATTVEPSPEVGQDIHLPPIEPHVTAPVAENLGELNAIYSPDKTDIWTYLDLTEKRDASDLHFGVDYPPMLRIDGKLEHVGSELLTSDRAQELFKPLLTKKQYEKFLENKEIDFSVQHKTGSRFRVNLYYEKGNIAAAFRLIPSKIRTIAELGMPEILNEFAKLPHGLVLVTGPTGSGKSTTIAAMINEINMTTNKHIISIEDPIEYLYGKGQALVDQREMEKDTHSWTNALRSVLRQDPDVVLVGEMRDYETIASTITVAETGHLVFATLHTNSASQTIDRIIDVFPEHQQQQIRAQLATVLSAVISQRLIPLKGGGRKAVVEILIGTPAVRNAIREAKTYQIDNMIQTSADVGMIPLEKSIAQLIKNGEIDLETALEFTTKPDQLRELVRS